MRIMAVVCGAKRLSASSGQKLEQTRGTTLVQAPTLPVLLRPMHKITTVAEMRSLAAELKSAGKKIALVGTQGALHPGQEALIRAAAERADVVVVSIFINPLQFGRNEIATSYPRNLEADLQICESLRRACRVRTFR
ncbi:MAG: pantoate--beta-alanine ligase [Opitutus sp.]|nr:pantoate--beta-alanine ligase [Opitutus sp.]